MQEGVEHSPEHIPTAVRHHRQADTHDATLAGITVRNEARSMLIKDASG
jgi:hypothetical protein